MARRPSKTERDSHSEDHPPAGTTNETDLSLYVRHTGLIAHHHVAGWCSGRHYCEQCKAWSDGPVCPGKRLGLPHLASSLAASSASAERFSARSPRHSPVWLSHAARYPAMCGFGVGEATLSATT